MIFRGHGLKSFSRMQTGTRMASRAARRASRRARSRICWSARRDESDRAMSAASRSSRSVSPFRFIPSRQGFHSRPMMDGLHGTGGCHKQYEDSWYQNYAPTHKGISQSSSGPGRASVAFPFSRPQRCASATAETSLGSKKGLSASRAKRMNNEPRLCGKL